DRSLDLAAAILRSDRAARVRGGRLHRLCERPDMAARSVLKMRKSSSPNMRQPAHANPASAANVNASEIGEPIGAGAPCCRIASKAKVEVASGGGAAIWTGVSFLKKALPVLRLPNPPTRSATS